MTTLKLITTTTGKSSATESKGKELTYEEQKANRERIRKEENERTTLSYRLKKTNK